MKKIFLFLLGIMFLTSCSNDTEESVMYDDTSAVVNSTIQEPMLKSTGVDPVLKELYIDMTNSPSYIDYDNAMVVFGDKVGVEIPDSELSSSYKMFAWISDNITLTGFKSYLEAVTEWDNIVALSVISNKANLQFVKYLANGTPDALLPILQELQYAPTGCSTCVHGFNGCMGLAASEYAITAQAASQQFTSPEGDINDYSSTISYAIYVKRKAETSCRLSFEECCTGGV